MKELGSFSSSGSANALLDKEKVATQIARLHLLGIDNSKSTNACRNEILEKNQFAEGVVPRTRENQILQGLSGSSIGAKDTNVRVLESLLTLSSPKATKRVVSTGREGGTMIVLTAIGGHISVPCRCFGPLL
jgi:hypothetical protein